MRIKGSILSCDFEDETLTIQLPKGFWLKKRHVIKGGEVVIESDSILPPRNTRCDACVAGLIHED